MGGFANPSISTVSIHLSFLVLFPHLELFLLAQARTFESCAALVICLSDSTAMISYRAQTRARFLWVPPMTRNEAKQMLDTRGFELTDKQRDQLFTHFGTLAGPLRRVAETVYEMPAEKRDVAIQAEINDAREAALTRINVLLEPGQPWSTGWSRVVLRLLDTIDPETAPLGGRARVTLPGKEDERNAAIAQLKMYRALHICHNDAMFQLPTEVWAAQEWVKRNPGLVKELRAGMPPPTPPSTKP
jgi:hypothetical protein